MANLMQPGIVYGNPDDPNFAKEFLVDLQTYVWSPVKFENVPITLKVHKLAHDAFDGFLKDLHVFYTIYDISSYNNRLIRGSNAHKSQHAWGNAIDINPTTNPSTHNGVRTTDMPIDDIHKLIEKYNLVWGGDWHQPIDSMHFEWGGLK